MLPGIEYLVGAGSVSATPTATFNAHTSPTAGSASYSVSMSIGTASSTRVVVITISTTGAGASISSVTVGGITATLAVHLTSPQFASVYYAQVSTGTSATVAITLGAACTGINIGSFSMYNLTSNTPFNTNTGTTTSSNAAVSTTINVTTNGIVIAVDTVDAPTLTNPTTTGITFEYNDQIFSCGCGGSAEGSGGLASGLSSQTGRSISFHYVQNMTAGSLCVASWG